MSRLIVLLSCLSLGFVLGCGSNYPKTYPVNGIVLMDGKPLPDVIVTLLPPTGNPATGTTDSNGKFSLSTFSQGDGALPGKYAVSIMPKDPPPMPGDEMSSPGGGQKVKYEAPIPTKYANPTTSQIELTVEAATNNPTIEISSK